MRCLVLLAALSGCQLVFQPLGPDSGPAPIDAPDAGADAAVDDVIDLACPEDYTESPVGSRYRIVLMTATWPTAEADCRGDLQDSTHLAVPDSMTELTFLATLVQQSSAWVGIARDVGTPAEALSFVAVTGETPDPMFWVLGQPDNVGTREHAAAILPLRELVSENYDDALPYICECDGKPTTKMFTFPL